MAHLPPQLFDRVARLFYSEEVVSGIRERLNLRPGIRLLDIPCGTGSLRDICNPSNYVGADLNPERIYSFREKIAGETLLVADSSKTPFVSKSFDRILVSGLFHHLDDAMSIETLNEFHRILCPEGKIVVFEAIWPKSHFNILGQFARKMDDGKFVRHPEEYSSLFGQYFRVTDVNYPSKLGLDYYLGVLSPLETDKRVF